MMMAIDVRTLLSIAIALAGAFYFFAPHDIHVSSGFGFGVDHLVHVVLGVVLFIAAAVFAGVKIFK
jgi:hypothetical protein